MSVRAGILVTGTEVITARITDRNGPWVSEQLAAHGIEVAHILVVGDRPEDLEAGLRFMAAEGCDLIVTSGGLGPTADDLTAEIVARFAGVELELDTEMEAKIAAIIAGFARRMRFSDDALQAANRKQAMVPRGAEALDPAGTAPGLVVPVEDGPVVVVLPGPPRELHSMWEAALATEAVRSVLDRAEPYTVQTMRMFGLPESEIAKSLREIGTETDLSPLEITTCLRRGELEIDVRHRPGRRSVPRGRRRRAGRAPRAVRLQPRRRHDRRAGRRPASRGPHDRARGVLHGRPARGAARQSARRLGIPARRRRHLLQPGEDRPARGRP